MTTGTLTTVEMGIKQQILEMGGGYVLDPGNLTFPACSGNLDVRIEPEEHGNAKAKGLRARRPGASRELTRVLRTLSEYRGKRQGDEAVASLLIEAHLPQPVVAVQEGATA